LTSSHLSFAKTNNEKEEDDKKYSKDIFDLSINKNETRNDNLKESKIIYQFLYFIKDVVS
jgi:hypothetical protein